MVSHINIDELRVILAGETIKRIFKEKKIAFKNIKRGHLQHFNSTRNAI